MLLKSIIGIFTILSVSSQHVPLCHNSPDCGYPTGHCVMRNGCKFCICPPGSNLQGLPQGPAQQQVHGATIYQHGGAQAGLQPHQQQQGNAHQQQNTQQQYLQHQQRYPQQQQHTQQHGYPQHTPQHLHQQQQTHQHQHTQQQQYTQQQQHTQQQQYTQQQQHTQQQYAQQLQQQYLQTQNQYPHQQQYAQQNQNHFPTYAVNPQPHQQQASYLCGLPVCPTKCPYGKLYSKDANGCDKCDCAPQCPRRPRCAENVECRRGIKKINGCLSPTCECNTDVCPPLTCTLQKQCPQGFARSETGSTCPTCECKGNGSSVACTKLPCLASLSCPAGSEPEKIKGCPVCVCGPPKMCPVVHCSWMPCQFGILFINGCKTCQCKPAPINCPTLQCKRRSCSRGFAADISGCPTCTCNPRTRRSR